MMGPYQRRVLDRSGRTARMSDLMREEAAIQGNAEMQAANASARAWQGIGNTVSDVAGTWARSEQERPRRELEEARLADTKQAIDNKRQITEVLKLTRDPETGQLDLRKAASEIAHIDPMQAQEFFSAASEQDKAALLANKSRLDQLGQFAGGILLDAERIPPPQRPAFFHERAQEAVQMGLIRPEDVPEQITESQLRTMFTSTLKTADLARMLEEQGKTPKVGSLEGFISTLESEKGAPLSRDEVLQARQQWEAAGRAPAEPKKHMVTVPGPDGRPMQRLATEEELAQGVTAYREPRQAPAAEALVAIVGPDGKPVYVPRSDAVGKAPASTREQGRQVISGDVEKITDFDTSLDDLGVIREALQGTAGATGTMAKIGAELWNPITEATGIGAEAKSRQATIDRVKQVIGKALEGGVLRKEDEEKYKKILPTIGDPPEVVESKLSGLEQAIRLRRERHIENLASAGYDTSRFPGGTSRPAAAAAVSVQTPDGQTFSFQNQQQADAFKKAAGIK